MANRDKKTAFWAMTLGVVVLVAVGVTSKSWVRETWYLHKLEHGDEEARKAVAEKLGELGSVRAIPGLFEALKDAEFPSVHSGTDRIWGTGTVRIWDADTGGAPSNTFLNLCSCPEPKFIYAGDPTCLRILSKITQRRPSSSLPHLITALAEGEDRSIRRAAAALLGQLDQDAEPAVPALKKASEADDEDLSHVARDALRSIPDAE